MINVIVPITENVEQYKAFIKENSNSDTKFFVGIKENLKTLIKPTKNVEIRVFSNKSKTEEIINSLQSSSKKKGKLMVARRPLSKQEFIKLQSSSKDVCYLKTKSKRFKTFWQNLAEKIIKKVFAFSFFQDISAICYSESMFELISVCENLSMATRINKYVGVEIEEVETIEKPANKNFSKTKNIMRFFVTCLICLGIIVGAVLMCVYLKTSSLIILLAIFMIVVSTMILGVAGINFARGVVVGDLHFGRAEEIIETKKRRAKNEKN